MTTCPDSGLLRAALDGETVPEAPAAASHAATCAACRETRDELQRNATLAAAVIGTLAPLDIPDPAAVEAALDAVRGGRSVADPDPVRHPRPHPAALPRVVAGATCLAVAAVLATPAGRSAAAAFLAR